MSDYWIIDVLPGRVSYEFGKRYSELEEHFREKLRERFAEVLLKLSCYVKVEERVNVGGDAEVFAGGARMTLDRDDAYVTLYDADDDMLSLLKELARSERLFVWKPDN